jgi:acyl-CoA thioester hydrolase
MGHVNNAVYATYLEYCRFDWFRVRFGAVSFEDFPFILARVEIDYKRPIQLTDRPVVTLRVGDIGASSWTFVYRITTEDDSSTVFAEGKSVQVAYDYKAGQKAKLEGKLRQQLEQEKADDEAT